MSTQTLPEFFVTHAKNLSLGQRLRVAGGRRLDKLVSKLAASPLIGSGLTHLVLMAGDEPLGEVAFSKKAGILSILSVRNLPSVVRKFREEHGHSPGEELIRHAVRLMGVSTFATTPVSPAARRLLDRMGGRFKRKIVMLEDPLLRVVGLQPGEPATSLIGNYKPRRNKGGLK